MRDKDCTKCNKRKKLKDFYKNIYGKYGVRGDCKKCTSESQKLYNDQNQKKIKVWSKKYRDKNKKCIKEYYKNNKDNLLKQKKNYYLKNKLKIRKYKIKNQQRDTNNRKARYNNDINFRIRCNLSNRVNGALKNNRKTLNTMILIGCEIDYLMFHIQNQFTEGMTWDNYGDWHIDHKLPCASFDLSKPIEQRQCFNYSNLQPLWAIDNLRKGSR